MAMKVRPNDLEELYICPEGEGFTVSGLKKVLKDLPDDWPIFLVESEFAIAFPVYAIEVRRKNGLVTIEVDPETVYNIKEDFCLEMLGADEDEILNMDQTPIYEDACAEAEKSGRAKVA